METFFKLKENGTNARTEIRAGFTTFFTMAYIIIVNPAILSLTGMNRDGVFVATIIATVVATLIMALFANLPYAQAPGMGLNAFFTFTICFGMGFDWREALAMVFICGLIGILITVTRLRAVLIRSIPDSLKNGIGVAIGLFIAYIGIKGAGLLTFTSDPGTYVDLGGTIVTNSSAVPALAELASAGQLLALIGLALTVVLLVMRVPGAILIGILATTVIGIPMGVVNLAGVQWFSVGAIGGVKDTTFAFFGNPGLGSMFATPTKAFMSVTAIFAFVLSDMFDTIGTFIGTGRVTGIFDKKDEEMMLKGNGRGWNSKIERGLLADASASAIGALFGTSNTTTYVESAAGIAQGGRTGLTSLTVAALFLICLPLSGLAAVIPGEATAPALIVVGIMMASGIARVQWDDFAEAAPVFLTVAVTAFAYNISYGIAAGLIFYCIIKIATGKTKDLNVIVVGASALFVINFIVRALQAAGAL